MKNYKRYMITSALPYANGPVHIGHLAGVYIPADIYVRYLRLKKRDVLFIGGSDEHGVPITIKAKQEGVTPQDIVDKYHGIIKSSFEKFGISFDIYSRTSSKTHYETASGFFKTLYDKGEFIEKTTEQYYDEEAKQFLADRYITGTCPHCGNENAYGDQCEKCGTSLNATDLINPKSTLSGNIPVLKSTSHWYLPLDKMEPFLKNWILEQNKHWKTNVYGQCKSWLDQGLQPRAVSRDLDWGIPVPVEGAKGKVLYVWFDAPIGYISATRELTPDWEKYWKDEDSRLIHFIGKDNIVFHCIIFPAMLKAEGSYVLPENVPANEFLNLEGDKISTSRNWAVWLHEYLEEFPGKEDVLRYVLAANMPETKDNDFTWKDFQTRNNSELVAIFGNFVNRALVLTQNYYQGAVPAPGTLTPEDQAALDEITTIKVNVEEALETFRFREALKEAMNLARLGNKYLADNEPWKLVKTDPERVQAIMYVSLQITASLAILMEPFLPKTSAALREMMNMKATEWETIGNIILQPGHIVNKPSLLFEKIEDAVIDGQLERLKRIKAENERRNTKAAPQKEAVNFDDFSKMDIRTGTILEAEKVAKTTKLMKLLVDTGIDKRTIVSGIAEHFTPEELPGKQVSILVNLEPRKIKGIESQGMILLAEDFTGKLIFVVPEKKTDNGAVVK
ncbi:MAG TPA: methionine--tRNA ligase [Bacteroidales bacterium]|nr:methionine--tRNA ligase [Bacteroidales bacterium]